MDVTPKGTTFTSTGKRQIVNAGLSGRKDTKQLEHFTNSSDTKISTGGVAPTSANEETQNSSHETNLIGKSGIRANGDETVDSSITKLQNQIQDDVWSPTDDVSFEVCFLTAVYSSSVQHADHPPDVQDINDQNPTFRFFAFTNLPDLVAPGWKSVVKNSTQYRRYITQSRWPKFMAWKHPLVQKCQAVFYMDGFCSPKMKHSERYKKIAKEIRQSKFGLFQNVHDTAEGPLDELDRIVERRKDILKNVEASKAWLLAQPDFRLNCTMYANHFIAYDPKSLHFQKASQFFWDHYSLEEDSWRDQPLWSYVLDKFHIQPQRLGTFKALFREYFKLMARDGHRYNENADNNTLS